MKQNLRRFEKSSGSLSTSGTVMARAAAHLNDINQLSYTSEVLLPMFNMALDEVNEELGVFELAPLKQDSIVIEVPIGSNIIPQMPVDFVESISLSERPNGGGEWIEVPEVLNIDKNLLYSDSIVQWTIRNTEIYINPPTSDREVILDYIRGLSEADDENTLIDIEASRRLLALLTARNAARDLGNSPSKAASYEADIGRARDRLVRRLQKNVQDTLGVRRLPYVGKGY